MTEFELMELLDVGMKDIKSAVTLISQAASPPCQSVSSFTLLATYEIALSYLIF